MSSQEYYDNVWFPISDQASSWMKDEILETLMMMNAGDKARRGLCK